MRKLVGRSRLKRPTRRGPARLVRIVVADRRPIVREGLGAVLSGEEDFRIVGLVEDPWQASDLAAVARPDIMLLGVEGSGDGNGLTSVIRRCAQHARVVVLVDSDEYPTAVAALRAGAASYLPKTVTTSCLVSAIRAVANGCSLLSTDVAHLLLREIAPPAAGPDLMDSGGRAGLTSRELEVLRLLSGGRTNVEIAQHLCISEKTVKVHVGNVLGKLGLRDRTQAALYAARLGLAPSGL